MNAPTNGPKIIPRGPTKNPMIRPIVEPVVAALLPPNFFVMKTGRKLSKTETKAANNPEIIKPEIEILQYSEKRLQAIQAMPKVLPVIQEQKFQ